MERQEQEGICKEFMQLVNMTAPALEKWLKTDESKSVGWDSGDDESIGHKSGEHIVKILNKNYLAGSRVPWLLHNSMFFTRDIILVC
jgi:Protein of unknown function (DUF3140)